MDVSIGVCVYNEEENIAKLLSDLISQKTTNLFIKEIIVVSSGSTDKTNEIVKNLSDKNKKIKLLTQPRREGKFSAINMILKKAKSKFIILVSGDLRLRQDSVQKLCKPFSEPSVGISAGRPIPLAENTILGSIAKLQWRLHHKIALKNPKYGEFICFRKIMKKIPKTAVDEEQIASMISDSGYSGVYASKAIVYNKTPETVSDFIRQRRRIYAGHLELKKNTGYKVPTLSNIAVFKTLMKEMEYKDFPLIFAGVLLEGYSRLLGALDFYKKRKHYVWDIAKTTK